MIPVRVQGLPTVFGPPKTVEREHPLYDTPCPACDEPLSDVSFDETTNKWIARPVPVALVYIGPGADPDDQRKARDGRWLTGAAVCIHAACAGVES